MRVRFLFAAGAGAARGAGATPGRSGQRWWGWGRLGRAALVPLVAGSLLPLAGSAAAAPATAVPAAGSLAVGGSGGAHGTGLQPTQIRVPAARGLIEARRTGAVRIAATVPTAMDLTGYAATPGDQGQVSSCVGWATGYTLLGWYANYQRQAGAPFAPMYVYSQINGGRDAGATIPSAWGILEGQGVAEQAVYPQGNYNWWTKPTAAETLNAALHKTRSHTYLFAGDNQGAAAQTALQAALAGNQPVVLGIPVHSGFGSLSPSKQVWRLADTTGKALLGYHALVAVGYDSTGVRIENSWGTGWGAAGFATLGWDFVNRYVIEASVGTGFTAVTPAAPKVTALSRTTLSTAGGETLTITGTGLSTVDRTAAGAAKLVYAADPAVTAPLTLTAATATTVTATTTAAPAGTGGAPVQGGYRVVLTGWGGSSSATDPAAAVTVVAPYVVTVPSGATALTTGGTKITLTGSGFGASSAAFTANKVTATVNAKPATVAWVSDTAVQVTVPASGGAAEASIVLLRGGVAGPAVSVRYVPPPPTVAAVTPAAVSSTGGTVTVTVTGLATVAANTATVRLVNVATPAVVATGQITARTGATLTVSVPAVPTDGAGRPVLGSYRVVVTGAGGDSAPNGTADQIALLTPYAIAVAPGALASAAGGTVLPVTGAGFGTSSALFAQNRITATVNGRSAPVAWVSDTQVAVTIPAGAPGAEVAVRLLRNGIASQPDSTARYAAVITASSQPAGPTRGGWTTVLTGVGFARSGSWALVDSAGTVVASLPVAATRDALTAAGRGVLLTSGTQATVLLPAAPAGRAGVYSLTFTPDQAAYPGAVTGLTSKAYVVYTDLG